jgi:hypothetical protein
MAFKKQANGGLQLRRAISIQPGRNGYLRSMLSRRQLQGFVRFRLMRSLAVPKVTAIPRTAYPPRAKTL